MTRLLVWIYRKIQFMFHFISIRIAKRIFTSNCSVGENFSCESFSKCINKTGNRNNIIIGNNCEIFGDILAESDGVIKIGSFTTIRALTRVFAVNNIEIGDYVIISNNVTIYDNNNHPTEPEERVKMCKSGFYSDLWQAKHSANAAIIIKNNVWIGERATILKGVTIGEGAIVGMCSVVTKDVPDYAVAVGNPAKIVKYCN
jgi:acetyltransferase-like isoleucine patch superfamily enzyme